MFGVVADMSGTVVGVFSAAVDMFRATVDVFSAAANALSAAADALSASATNTFSVEAPLALSLSLAGIVVAVQHIVLLLLVPL